MHLTWLEGELNLTKKRVMDDPSLLRVGIVTQGWAL